MPGVMMPQKKQGLAQQVAPVAGQAVGTYFGGPIGGVVGGQIGAKMAGEQKQIGAIETSAINRRIDTYQPPQNHTEDLAAADQALAQLPKPVQQQYSPILRRAMEIEAQRGMA